MKKSENLREEQSEIAGWPPSSRAGSPKRKVHGAHEAEPSQEKMDPEVLLHDEHGKRNKDEQRDDHLKDLQLRK